MSSFEEKANICKRYVMPGIWVDMNNNPHISLPELLDHFEIEDTPENREMAAVIAKDAIRQAFADAGQTVRLISRPIPGSEFQEN